MRITNKIKFYREEKKLTQKELAQKSNLSERNLQSIEAGAQDPKISTVLKISHSLNVPVEDLFPLPSEETSPSKTTRPNDSTEGK